MYIYITAEKTKSCYRNNFKEEKVLWEAKNASVKETLV